ncbi:aldo/keto reductase [Lentzea sp. NPDC004782]|uniref:aldo/keto reductase n=1 Tax=Lentzea sp. NPDC004782 TaxID=3154458 RepID=UPI0033AABEEB
MEQRKCGGLKMSEIGLGTATWGATTGRDDARDQLKEFAAAGGSLVDTADFYGQGRSEEMIGDLLGRVVQRSDVVLASKAGVIRDGSLSMCCSAEHLLSALDTSLRRLRTDHLDLWQLHGWDPGVQLEETLQAVDVALNSGRVRHAGVCNYTGWQTAKAAYRQQAFGHGPLVSTQVEYSLLQRGIEREVVPAARDANMGILAWAALGRGVLTGKYQDGVPKHLWGSSFFRRYVSGYVNDHCNRIVSAVALCAQELDVSPLAVALSWVRAQPGVAAAVIGARTTDQLRESLTPRWVELRLPPDVMDHLDEVSRPCTGYPESGI